MIVRTGGRPRVGHQRDVPVGGSHTCTQHCLKYSRCSANMEKNLTLSGRDPRPLSGTGKNSILGFLRPTWAQTLAQPLCGMSPEILPPLKF